MKENKAISGKGEKHVQRSCGRKECGTTKKCKKANVCRAESQDSMVSEEVAEVGKPHLRKSYRMLNVFVYT